MSKKDKKEDSNRFWWIYNQEEAPVALAYAKTSSGALSKFEMATGNSRASYRAEEVHFQNMCALTNQV